MSSTRPAAQRAALRPRRVSRPMALEPRFMFDGALALDVTHDLTSASPQRDPWERSKAPEEATPGLPLAPATATTGAFAPAATLSKAAAAARPEILFVEPGVAGHEAYIAHVRDGIRVVLLDPSRDPWQQMSQALEGGTVWQAVHLLSHGTPGQLAFAQPTGGGGQDASARPAEAMARELSRWASFLDADADILLYGCSVGAGPDGQALIDRIARLTQADVAASDDPTGRSGAQGDWVLEQRTGAVDAALAFDPAWLATAEPGLLQGSVPNTPATVADGVQSVAEGSAGTPLLAQTLALTDADLDRGEQTPEQIVFTLIDAPAHGFLTLDGNPIGPGSTFHLGQLQDGLLAYAHTAGGTDTQNDADGFSVKVNDGATPLADSDTAQVNLVITPVNQAPSVSGSGSVFEGQPRNATSGGVAQSAVGLFVTAEGGGDPGDDVLDLRLDSLPAHGTLHFTGQAVIGGTAQTLDRVLGPQDIASGFVIAYADRGGLRYAHDGVDPSGVPPDDGFDVTVTDGGGGLGAGGALSASARIVLDIQPVNDDPVWVEASTLNAAVTAAGPNGLLDGGGDDYRVVLTSQMLSATDVDSAESSITFVLTAAPAHGHLLVNNTQLLAGATFSLADVRAGRVQYVQTAVNDAGSQPSDGFAFQVRDNTLSLRWDAQGEDFLRVGGIYSGDGNTDPLRTFDFGLTLALSRTGSGGSGETDPTPVPSSQLATNYVGRPPTGATLWPLADGQPVLLTEGASVPVTSDLLRFAAGSVPTSQIVFTIGAFHDAAGAPGSWNGSLQKDGVALRAFEGFTQADVDAGRIRYVHDGGEDFASSVTLYVSAGGAGNFATHDFHFYTTPVNDAPVATGSTGASVVEGAARVIGAGQLAFSDADDATSESYVEDDPDIADNHRASFALDNAAWDGAGLRFRLGALPSAGALQVDPTGTGQWTTLTAADVAQQTLFDTALVGQGRLRYVHDGGEARADSFSVVARDRWGQDSAPATVGLVVTNLNDAPAIAADPTAADPTAAPGAPNLLGGPAVNDPLTTVPEGGSARIDASLLRALDPDSSAQQVQYRLTAVPTAGRLALSTNGFSFTTLGVGASFSQQQVHDGQLYYLHDGAEPASAGYPGTPDDRFTFTLSDGNREQVGNAFWIYVRPMNDRPTLTVPTGPVDIDSALAARNAVVGVAVDDPDLSNGAQSGETDFVQVTVRLLDADGVPVTDLAQGLGGGGVTFGHALPADASGAWAVTRSGVREVLQLQGTRAQVNEALAGLSVTLDQDLDTRLQLQVIVDDRVRDVAGALVASSSRVLANGGDFNQAATAGSVPSPVPSDAFDWGGGAEVPAGHANVAQRTVELRASRDNDAAVLTGPTTAPVDEDTRSLIGGVFTVADAESAGFDTPMTVTLSVASGRLDVAAAGVQTRFTPTGGRAVTIAGDDSASVTLTGRAADIQALLNRRDSGDTIDDANGGLFYTGATHLNHDLNGDAAGDVTLTLTLDDAGSRIGGDLGAGSVANLPSPWQIGLAIAPVNDAPVVMASDIGLTVDDDTPTAVSGFTLSDVDALDGHAAGEQDVRTQVLMRLLDAQRVPLSAATYAAAGIRLDSSAVDSGAVVDPALDGQTRALRLLGTRSQIDAWLQGLRLTSTLPDAAGAVAYVEVVADDRARGPQGQLTGGADGGARNQQPGLPPVPAQDSLDPYATTVTAYGVYNVTASARVVTIVPANDPGEVHVDDVTVAEGSPTLTLDALQGGLRITDPDAGPAIGVSATVALSAGRIVAVGGSGGQVEGLDTSAVTISGVSLAQLNARLQALTLALPDPDGPDGPAAAADFNGALSVTVTYHDGGLSGGRPTQLAGDTNDPQRNPGDVAYADATGAALVTTRTFGITVTPVNDAPQRADTQPARLAAVAEDAPESGPASPAGATVATLFGPRFADPLDDVAGGAPAHTLAGVAVTGNAALATQGRWQVALGDGAWADLPPVDTASALVLAAGDRLRFLPAPDFHGTPGGLSVRLADSSGPALTGGSRVDLSDTGGLSSGTSRYADSANAVDLVTEVLPVNDRPTAQDATLAATAEDAADPPGQAISSIAWGFADTLDDQRAIPGGGQAAGAVGGLAIVGNAADRATQGLWQYRLDGDWVDIGDADGAPSQAAALVLPAEAALRFLPVADFNGRPGVLTVHVADAAQALQAGIDLRGAFTPTGTWSDAVQLSTTVDARNDAPVLAATVSNPLAVENDDTGSGASVPAVRLLSSARLTDVDLAGTAGLQAGIFGAGTIRVSLDDPVAGDVLGVGGTLPEGVQLSGGTDGQPLTVTLRPQATLAEAEALLNALRFWHTGDDPDLRGTDTTRTYRISVFDADNAQAGGDAGGPAGLASNELTGTVTLQARNDATVVDLDPGTASRDRDLVWLEPADAPHDALPIAPGAVLSDADNATLSRLTLTVAGLRDGDAEELVVAGQAFSLASDHGDNVVGAWRAQYDADTRTLSLVPEGAATAPVADFQTLLRGIGYRSTTDLPTEGLRSVQVRVTDAGAGDAGTDPAVAEVVTARIDVRAANDAPVHTRPTAYTVDEDGALALTGLAVADGDIGPGTMTLRLSVAHGTLSAASTVPGGVPSAGVDGHGTAQLALTGTLAQINTTLAAAGALVYRPAADRHGSDTLTMRSDDGGHSGAGGARVTTDTVDITIRAVNDAPALTLPSAQWIDEDTVLSLAGLRVADVDAGDAPLTLTLTVAHGTLQLATDVPGSVAAASVSGNGTATVTVQASAAALHATLAHVDGLQYRPTADFHGTDTLSVTADDGGASGSGGARTSSGSVALDVRSVNDAPVNTVPGPLSLDEGGMLALTGLALADVDAGEAGVRVTLSVAHGRLEVLDNVAGGLDASGIQGQGSTVVVLEGTLAQVNATLAAEGGVRYRPDTGFVGDDTLTMTSSDRGHSGAGGALTDTDTVMLTVRAVNDAPVLTVPGALALAEDGAVQVTGLSVADADAGVNAIVMTLSVGHGTLHLLADVPGGLGASMIAGNGSGSVALTGTLAQLNATLASSGALVYRPLPDFAGADTLTVQANDQGHGGAGGPRTDLKTVALSITAVNDAPAQTMPGALTVDEDTDLAVTGLRVADVDAADGVLRTTLSVGAGTLRVRADAPGGLPPSAIVGNGSAQLTLTGTLAQLNATLAALDGVVYRASTDFHGSDTLTLSTDDLGGRGSGGAQVVTDTVALTVRSVNDAPRLQTPLAQTTSQDTPLALAGLSMADVDAGDGTVALTLSVAHGRLDLREDVAGGLGAGGIAGNGSASVTLWGRVPQIAATLAASGAVVYRPDAGFHGADTLTLSADDQGLTGAGGPRTSTATVGITVLEDGAPPPAPNQPPVHTAPALLTGVEDGPLTISGLSVADPDVGGQALRMTLSVAHGRLTVSDAVPGGLGADEIEGNGSRQLVLTGPQERLNATLAALGALVYQPDAQFHGDDTLTLTTSDRGYSGSGGERTDTDTVTLRIAAVDDAPVLQAPAAVQVEEDSAVAIAGVSVEDPDGANTLVELRLGVAHGTLQLADAVPGGLPATGIVGQGSAALTLAGTVAQLNATLGAVGALVYRPDADRNGTDTLTLEAADPGPGGAVQATRQIHIDILAVNDAPVQTVPGALAVDEDTDLAIAGLRVDDVDTGDGLVQTVLTVQQGVLRLRDDVPGGLGVTGIAGNGSASVTLTGTLAQVNATLAAASGVVYRASTDFHGGDALTMRTDDRSNSGAGGAGVDVDTVALTVRPVNDAPRHQTPDALSVLEDGALEITGLGLDDVDAGDGIVRLSLGVGHGTLHLRDDVPGGLDASGISGNGSASATLWGRMAQINLTLAAAGAVVYRPQADFEGADLLTLQSSDNGLSGAGGVRGDTDTVALTVVGVNDAPTVSAPAQWTAREDEPTALTGLSVTDVDAGTGELDVRLSVTHGTLIVRTDLTDGVAAARITGNGTSQVRLVGRLTEIQATLAAQQGLVYQGSADFAGSDALSIRVDDPGRGADATLTTSTVPITVTPVNDAPQASGHSHALDPGQEVAVQLGSGALDADGDALTVATVAGLAFDAWPASTDPALNAGAGYREIALAHGTLFLKADGSGVYRHAGRSFDWTPDAGVQGVVEWQTSDGSWQPVATTRTIPLADLLAGRLRYTPAGSELGASEVPVGQLIERPWTQDTFDFRLGDGQALSTSATVQLQVRDPDGRFESALAPGPDPDGDGVTSVLENALAAAATGAQALQAQPYVLGLDHLTAGSGPGRVLLRADARVGADLNADGIDDARQPGVVVFGWSTDPRYITVPFDPSVAGAQRAIVGLVAEASATSLGQAHPGVQLHEVEVLALSPDQQDRLAEIVRFDTTQDNLRFAARGLGGFEGLGIDIDPVREGQQWRFTLDVARAGLVAADFVGFYKWIDAATIDAYGQAGLPLLDLDGRAITRDGWVDFTQRTPGGDGVRLLTDAQGVRHLEFIVTDNRFGDSDPIAGRIADPGLPAFVNYASDDRPLSVNDVEVSEASPYVVFKVSGAPKQWVHLALQSDAGSGWATLGTDVGTDVSTSVEAFDGSTWQPVAAGVPAEIPADESPLLVRVAVRNDFLEEGKETFRLVATNTGGISATGTGTLVDDGSVKAVFTADNTTGDPTDGVADDDRPRAAPPRDTGGAGSRSGSASVSPWAGFALFGTDSTAMPPPAGAFESALVVTRASTLPLPQGGLGDALMTRDSGFRVVVLDASTPGPSVFRGMADLSVDAGQRTEIVVSGETFAHPQADAVVSLAARLANGSALPAWVRFDADRGTFVITAPPGMRGALEIVLVARDQAGREAMTTFRLQIDGPTQATAGRPGLSEQLRAAGQRPGALSALLRPAAQADRGTEAKGSTATTASAPPAPDAAQARGQAPTPRPAVPTRGAMEAGSPVREAAGAAAPRPAADRSAERPSFAAKQRPQR